MTISDEKIFILGDEIIAHIYSSFPSPDNHNERVDLACAALRALINVIGVVLCEIDCRKCWELMLGALQRSFVQLVKDAPP